MFGVHLRCEGLGAIGRAAPDGDGFERADFADGAGVGGGLLAGAEDGEMLRICKCEGVVATALAAAVRIAVTSPAWTTQTGVPVSGSNRTMRPWCDCLPCAAFS